MMVLFAAILAIAAVGLIASIRGRGEKRNVPVPAASAMPAQTGTPGAPQPGPAPAGKVWSTEHGHWHDANPAGGSPVTAGLTPTVQGGSAVKIEPLAAGQQLPATTAPITVTPSAAPPGPAPAGKVWSAEHNHWHDANPAAPAPTPAPVVQRNNTPQPAGPAPAGKVWSAEHGHWHDAPKP